MNRNDLKRIVKEIVSQESAAGTPNLNESTRARLKTVIKKIVLNEILKDDFGFKQPAEDTESVKAVQKAVGKTADVGSNRNGKITAEDGEGGDKFQCNITEAGTDLYNVEVIKDGSQRCVGRQLSPEKLAEFLRNSVKSKESYVDAARTKSMNALGKNEEKDAKTEEKAAKKEEKNGDQMVDVKEKKQIDIADDGTKDAEEDSEIETTPGEGGDLIEKVERIIDRVLKAKANAKTAHLKVDPKMKSPDTLTTKIKDTPPIKRGK